MAWALGLVMSLGPVSAHAQTALGVGNRLVLTTSENAADNCDRLRAVLDGIVDSDADTRYEVILGPATFSCGDSLSLPAWVSVVGAGRNATRIVGQSFGGVVKLGEGAAIRALSVENDETSNSTSSIAVTVTGDRARLEDVLVLAALGPVPSVGLYVDLADPMQVDVSLSTIEGGDEAVLAVTDGNVVVVGYSELRSSGGAGLIGGDGKVRCVFAHTSSLPLDSSCALPAS